MKFNIQALALSTGIVGVAFFALCNILIYSFPNMMGTGTGMMGGMMGFNSGHMMGGNILVGAIIIFVITWAVGWLLGTLYNHFSKK